MLFSISIHAKVQFCNTFASVQSSLFVLKLNVFLINFVLNSSNVLYYGELEQFQAQLW